jgi:hypothetical protein
MKKIVLHGVRAAIQMKKEAMSTGVFLGAWLALLVPACTNHGVKISRGPSSTLSQVSTSQTTGDFSLIQMSPDPISPGSVYALIGQNQEFEQYCNSGTSNCECEFSYQQPGIGAQILNVAPTYVESDMLRCPNQVPSGIESFDVRIRALPVQAGGTIYQSNRLTYSLGSGNNTNLNSAIYLDLTDENSFVPVQRYQCRKREFIANPLDKKIADPFQTVDPRVIYPFNYYTTNVSESLLRMQRGLGASTGTGGSTGSGSSSASQGDQSWECTLNATPDSKLHWWANPAVYSSTACTNDFCSADGELMYPTSSLSSGPVPALDFTASTTGKRRSSFSLARRAYGVFQTPVIAAIAPLNYVSSVYSSPTSPLGWAAKPIPAVNGSSTCPAITLPDGARWVKLWNFRALNVAPSQTVTDSVSAASSTIGCRPPKSFASCQRSGEATVSPYNLNFTRASSGAWLPLDESLPSGSLSARVVMPTRGSAESAACFNHTAFSNGEDSWIMSRHKFNNLTDPNDMKAYPWGIYSGNATLNRCNEVSSSLEEWMSTTGCANPMAAGSTGTLANAKPGDGMTNLAFGSFSTQPYTDNLFVVTEANVSDQQMAIDPPDEYTPVTFRAKAACMAGGNPSSTRVGCPNNAEFQGTQITWQNSRIEVNANSISTQYVYPLCVVQFTE